MGGCPAADAGGVGVALGARFFTGSITLTGQRGTGSLNQFFGVIGLLVLVVLLGFGRAGLLALRKAVSKTK